MAHHMARVRMIRSLWVAFICLSLALLIGTYHGVEKTPHAGLAVSWAALQVFFARPELSFIFGDPHKSCGVPSSTGIVSGKLMALELLRPPENLTQVTLMLGVPSTNPLHSEIRRVNA